MYGETKFKASDSSEPTIPYCQSRSQSRLVWWTVGKKLKSKKYFGPKNAEKSLDLPNPYSNDG